MLAPIQVLTASLKDRACRVIRREGDWNFCFSEGVNISASVPWRVVTADGIAHGSDDHGQWFGLPQPIDGEVRTNHLLEGQRVIGVEVDALTADLQLTFDGGARLDFFNSSAGYEGWQALVSEGSTELAIIALGGGKLSVC